MSSRPARRSFEPVSFGPVSFGPVSLEAVWPVLFLLLLVAAAVWPLLLYGPSCGHDFGFHMQSWMDASAQLRSGILLPRWAYSPAFNAGEPRFIFYPPLSWLLGSLLMLALPPAAVPAAYTAAVLTGAAVGMYRLALVYTSPSKAVLAAAVYLANPYLLFTAYERTAFAELLAAAWMPLLFRAVLAEALSPLAIAVPLALLWLTNAPAAVMGTYAAVLIVLTRLALRQWSDRRAGRQANLPQLWRTVGPAAGGLALGLLLPAFYLLPAAWERRYVQIAMAIIPNMRVEDNFLFGGTGYGPHDRVLHTASVVSLGVMAATACLLVVAFLVRQSSLGTTSPSASQTSVAEGGDVSTGQVLPALAVVAALLSFMLFHISQPLWHYLPELAFLQFPWRLLAVLGCVLGLAAALALRSLTLQAGAAAVTALLLVGGMTALAIRPFRQGCEAQELPTARVALFRAHHGVGPTDEYTPTDADNDVLRWDDPAWWLATSPNQPGPNTVPNPAETILDYDQPPPLDQTISGHAPAHLALHLTQPRDLVFNLREYPAWGVTVDGKAAPGHLGRDDGLLALALPAGDHIVDIHWRTLPDVWAGDALTALGLTVACWVRVRSRRIKVADGF